jgi:hypothetical protein
MTSISFLFLCAALVPALLVARNWWMVARADDVLDGYRPVVHPSD